MPPQFSLQVVLDYRSSIVEALEIQLGQLMAAHRKAQRELMLIREHRNDLMQDLRESQMGSLDLVKISHLRTNIEMVDTLIVQKQEEVNNLARQVEMKRQELVKARQDEEVLEILKQKAIEQFEAELKLKEARFQDDIYISNHYQKTIKEANVE